MKLYDNIAVPARTPSAKLPWSYLRTWHETGREITLMFRVDCLDSLMRRTAVVVRVG
jgi:hypothetical protein